MLPDPTPTDFEGLRDAVMETYQEELIKKGKPANYDLTALKEAVDLLHQKEARLENKDTQTDASNTKE